MQVTKNTFAATLGYFEELLQTCDFYAFDEEMTGINVGEVTESITFSPEDSYEAKRLAASRFSLIQVGICLFHKVSPAAPGCPARYEARPFNFVLFPSHRDDYTAEERSRDVVMSPSAIAFLRRHNMDFQKWVYDGIAVCDAPQETALAARVAKILESENADVAVDKTGALQALLTDAERKWVEEAVRSAKLVESQMQAAISGGQDAVVRSESRVMPTPCSKSTREHLEARLAAEGSAVVVSARRSGAAYTVTLTCYSPAEAARRREREALARQRAYTDILGFRLAFKALVASRKPCVGHNCFADLLFLMSSFDEPLAASLSEWKLRAARLFPLIFDTRYVACRTDLFAPGRFPARNLGSFFDQYGLSSPHAQVTLPLGFQAYSPICSVGGNTTGGAAHEAGYDALMTGTLLINLLGEMGCHSVAEAPADVKNRIALFRSLFAVAMPQQSSGSIPEDEYLPAGVVELQHGEEMRPHNLESCLAVLDYADASVHTVSDTTSLVTLPKLRAEEPGKSVEALVRQLNERFSTLLRASRYTPSTTCSLSAKDASAGATGGGTFSFVPPPPPSAAAAPPLSRGSSAGGGSLLRPTIPQRMRWPGAAVLGTVALKRLRRF